MSSEHSGAGELFLEEATAFWQERGGRLTVVRETICHCVLSEPDAFDAESLWENVRKKDRGISISSIYRTLADLVAAGLLNEIRGPKDNCSYVRSDSSSLPTGHLICKDCRRIFPLDDKCLALREGPVVREMGFHAGGMHMQIEAACESLKRCGSCKNR